MIRGVGRKKLVVVLVEQPARLRLEVGPVGVGKQIFPDRSVARERPAEEFLSRHFLMNGPVAVAEIRVVPVGAVGFLKLAMDEVAAAFVQLAMVFV